VTGNYKVIVSSTGTVTGAAQNTGWVEGNLQRHFANATNVSRTFDIGGTLYYTPVAVNIASVTTAGSLIARAVSTDHPSIGTSVISSTRNVNRYWSITNSGVVFTTASVTLNWNSADVDATADPVFFQVARFSSSVWSQPVQANPLTTSIEATGLTVFGDFVAGELLNVTRWTGALSTDWNTAGNWTPSAIPVATNNITIPGTATLYPVISSGITAIKDLVIEASASLTVSGATLQISGSISNEGTFTAANGSIEFNGTLSQSIPSGVFATNTIKDLIVNNGSTVTLQDTLKLTNLLSVKKGSLVTKGFLTLKSTATGTARVDVITSAAATPINGAVTVERYVQGRRRYRLMTSPVTTSSSNTLTTGQEALSIWAAWQNSGSTLVSNYGTFITGGTAADGFDTQVSGASMYTYDAANRRWVGFTSAIGKNTRYTPLKAGVAYYMFVYGDRKNSLSSSTPNYTVLSATGTLLSGTQTYNTGSNIALNNTVGGFTLLGNPFASPINWASLPKTNLENTYWGWDPNLSGTGGYVTVSTAGGTTLIAPFSGTVGLNQYIQSGQGFFVRTTAASPELQIRESDKTGTYNGNAFRKSNETKRTGDVNNPNSIPLLAMNVFYENSGSKILADGALMAFDASFNKGVGAEDAIKMFPSTESISVVNGSDFVSIDGRPLPSARDTVRLAAYRLTKSQYTFEIFAQQLQDKNVHAYLEDTYLNTKQALNLLDTNRILVNVNTSIPTSADVNRFRILFE
ncbi:MAG: hypothetical protein M3Q06_08305, partial [Bacteroidota bacterium]|nr:hypothetical protein [Bacteroidota bacterium]